MTAQFPTPGASPVIARDFSPEELIIRNQAQQRLIQQRLNARVLDDEGARRLQQPRLFAEVPTASPPVSTGRHFESPPRPAAQETLPASLDAALSRIRRPRPGTPAARALDALERAKPLIHAHIRRRDARHNAAVVYRALAQAAYTLIDHRGQQADPVTSYTLFTVVDLLPVVTGLSSDQCERATRRLQEIGLIHKTSGAIPLRRPKDAERDTPRVYRGGTWTPTTFWNAETGERVERQVCAGTWVAILLRPAPGAKARVIAHELPACPRDLTADRKQGRTAWQIIKSQLPQEVRESISPEGDKFDITYLLIWSLPEKETVKSVGTIDSRTSPFSHIGTPQELVWGLSRIVTTHPQRRREAIQEATEHLVRLLNDQGWERHYYRLLWRATDAEARGLPAYNQLAHALERTLIATRELHLARPGAWLTHQLADCGWMDAVYHHSALPKAS